MMSERLKQAVEQAAANLPAEAQDALAAVLTRLTGDEPALKQLVNMLDADDEATWQALFAEDWDKFDRLADKASADIRAGLATPLDPDRL